jgi:hypothetical protein
VHRIAALAAVTLLLAGCGAQSGGAGGGGTVSPSPATSATSAKGCTVRSTFTAADSGRRICLATGDVVRVSLDGTPARPWTPVAVTGSALEATNSGIVLRPGDASAAFKAVAAGTARLSASRPLCATDPGRVACEGLQEWWVTVAVT